MILTDLSEWFQVQVLYFGSVIVVYCHKGLNNVMHQIIFTRELRWELVGLHLKQEEKNCS